MIIRREEKAGFTLMEMVVSLSIITIITVLFIANYHSANRRTDLVMASQNLVADLHMAQNNTLGLVKYYDTADGTIPAGGWGVNFDAANNRYTIFADLDAPSNDPNSGYMKYDQATEGQVKSGARVIQLPPQLQIAELKTGSNFVDPAVNVTFLPPDPQTNIYRVGAGATSTSLEIKLKELQSNTTKTIRVNFLGLIEVTN